MKGTFLLKALHWHAVPITIVMFQVTIMQACQPETVKNLEICLKATVNVHKKMNLYGCILAKVNLKILSLTEKL